MRLMNAFIGFMNAFLAFMIVVLSFMIWVMRARKRGIRPGSDAWGRASGASSQ
jgi:hypothetical protein